MIFFTSDQHFGHRNIIDYSRRPFRDVDEMNEALITRHNEIVGVDDVVWHLGDFSLDDRLVKKVLFQLNGEHHLIVGNHDTCHPIHKRWERAALRYTGAGFRTVNVEATIDVPDLGTVRLHHMPYEGDHTDVDRYRDERPVLGGESILLHGHVHELFRFRSYACGTPPRHAVMVNVGVDQWDYAPVSPGRIKAALDAWRAATDAS